MRKLLILAVLVCLGSLSLKAQDLLEGSQRFVATATFASSGGNHTNNGTAATFEARVTNHVWMRADQYGLDRPAGAMLSLLSVQNKWNLAHAIKPTPFFNTQNVDLSIHVGAGALKDPTGHVNFAVGAGFSVDYTVPNMAGLFLRPLDVTVAHSSGIGNNLQVIGEWPILQTGLGFRF